MFDTQCYKRQVLVVFILSSGIIAPAAFLPSSTPESACQPVEYDEQDVLEKYGELFLTDKEVETFVKKTIETATNNSHDALRCLTNTSLGSTPWERCDGQIVINGCCQSRVRFQELEFAPGFLYNNNLTLIHIRNRTQLFSWEDCSADDKGCTEYCKCQNVLSYATAIIKTSKGASMRRIKYKGCCHCMNNFRRQSKHKLH